MNGEKDRSEMSKFVFVGGSALGAGLFLASISVGASAQTHKAVGGVQDHAIAYVMIAENYTVYIDKNQKTQCPNGLNDGPSVQFKKMYPDSGDRTVLGTQLAWEGELWNPTQKDLNIPYFEPVGKIGKGLNLDGKVGPNDFVSPDGEAGIDNQLYRVMGCTYNYRDGHTAELIPQFRRDKYNLFVIELTNVDSLADDDDVTVTTYRGSSRLLTDASGKDYPAGGTQVLDTHWGKRYIQTFKGKIKDGVLTTDAKDILMPLASFVAPRDGAPDILYRDMRFRLTLSPLEARGYMGGYADVWSWYYQSHRTRDTAHQDYGGVSGPTLWRSLLRNADAYPDSAGQNTAISTALDVRFVQTFAKHPPAQIAGGAPLSQRAEGGAGAYVRAQSRDKKPSREFVGG